MGESFQRRVNADIQTHGDKIHADPRGALAGASQSINQAVNHLFKEEDKDTQVRKMADDILDEAAANQKQNGWSATKTSQWLSQKTRDIDPKFQREVMKEIAFQRTSGGFENDTSLADIRESNRQAALAQGLAIATQRLQSPEKANALSEEELMEVYNQSLEQQNLLAQAEKEKQQVLQNEKASNEAKLKGISNYALQNRMFSQTTMTAVLKNIQTADTAEESLNLLTTAVENGKIVKSQVLTGMDQMLQSLPANSDEYELAKKQVDDTTKIYDSIIKDLEDMKNKPLEEMKRSLELKQTSFALNNELVWKAETINGFLSIVDNNLKDQYQTLVRQVVTTSANSESQSDFLNALSDGGISPEEYEGIIDNFSDEEKVELSLKTHKLYLESFKNGSKDALNGAKAAAFYILNNKDNSSSEAHKAMPLLMETKQALYPELNDVERKVFDFQFSEGVRGSITDGQTGILANLPSISIPQEEAFIYKDGKLTVNPILAEPVERLSSGDPRDRALNENRASRQKSILKDYQAAANKLNSYIAEASSLDSPALKELSDEQRVAYLTSSITGESLSNYSNLPVFQGSSEDISLAVSSGKTTEEVEEKRTQQEEQQDLASLISELNVISDDPEALRSKSASLRERYQGKIKESTLNMMLGSLDTIANTQEIDRTERVNNNRTDNATVEEEKPSPRQAKSPAPKEVVEDKEFIEKNDSIARELNVDPEDLLRVMHFETGGSFDPAQKNNAGGSAVGLIQFIPAVAEELGTSPEELANMSRSEQMDVVGDYLKKRLRKVKNPTLSDLYMAVLRPRSVGKPEDSTVYEKGSKAYEQNKGLDTNKDGKITKAEATEKVKKNTAFADLKSLLADAKANGDLEQTMADIGLLDEVD